MTAHPSRRARQRPGEPLSERIEEEGEREEWKGANTRHRHHESRQKGTFYRDGEGVPLSGYQTIGLD